MTAFPLRLFSACRRLGDGLQAEVWLVKARPWELDAHLDVKPLLGADGSFAVKIAKTGATDGILHDARLQREAQILSSAPAGVGPRVGDFRSSSNGTRAWLPMERVPGVPLRCIVDRSHCPEWRQTCGTRCETPIISLDPQQLIALAQGAWVLLRALHTHREPLSHGDVNYHHLMVELNHDIGTGLRVRFVDFGFGSGVPLSWGGVAASRTDSEGTRGFRPPPLFSRGVYRPEPQRTPAMAAAIDISQWALTLLAAADPEGVTNCGGTPGLHFDEYYANLREKDDSIKASEALETRLTRLPDGLRPAIRAALLWDRGQPGSLDVDLIDAHLSSASARVAANATPHPQEVLTSDERSKLEARIDSLEAANTALRAQRASRESDTKDLERELISLRGAGPRWWGRLTVTLERLWRRVAAPSPGVNRLRRASRLFVAIGVVLLVMFLVLLLTSVRNGTEVFAYHGGPGASRSATHAGGPPQAHGAGGR